MTLNAIPPALRWIWVTPHAVSTTFPQIDSGAQALRTHLPPAKVNGTGAVMLGNPVLAALAASPVSLVNASGGLVPPLSADRYVAGYCLEWHPHLLRGWHAEAHETRL